MQPPEAFSDAEEIAERIIAHVGRDIVLGLPLGLGKANRVANALYRRAARDPSVSLRIFTGLTLQAPSASSEIEKRFVGPLAERLYAGYPPLEYAAPMRRGELPANVAVNEFFFLAGKYLSSPAAQQSYISANYTHATRALLDRGVNVLAQMVARKGEGADATYSLSCNTDITLDILPTFRRRRETGEKVAYVGEVNNALPYMPGPAELPASDFEFLLDAGDHPLFVTPKPPISLADYAIGLNAASMVPDGGTLQIGIGSIGDALTHALILRHRAPEVFCAALDALGPPPQGLERHCEPFREGLYGASEMFVDGFLDLYEAGILKRPAHDGAILHAGFFLGQKSFYERLKALPEAERMKLSMREISFVNELYGVREEEKRQDRRKARFVNNAMMATLMGAIVSDQLEDGRVVSGVGGQYNFVAQAFALQDAHSVMALHASRTSAGRPRSNIVWSYGHETVPRHLKDIVVTEYGIASLRGRTDSETIAAMLAIADARFQADLEKSARSAGKLEKAYRFTGPENTRARIETALSPFRREGHLPRFPLGTDFTADEQALLPALAFLKGHKGDWLALAKTLREGWRADDISAEEERALARMQLQNPSGLKERALAALILGALRKG
ncbi:acetyl-CoA hydrolase/transferase C-terminal domain-containing protein [Afifella sp. IM 167]|uniref:acetyl-CoA hydrolase/transferase C-terminal domain-containing protein n=1 Tax=Afifella sp. IM 167 TaxID=2033586 RepID=UPI001CCAF803|nr:acetyl-CoA hydrolase [Afifella sp. IM 167]